MTFIRTVTCRVFGHSWHKGKCFDEHLFRMKRCWICLRCGERRR